MTHDQAKVAQEHVLKYLEWYRANTKWPMFAFRLSGIATIILGAALPAVVSMDEKIIPDARARKIAVIVMSVSLAALTALSAFYRWEKTWHGRNAARRSLELLMTKFNMELADVKPTDDDEDSCKRREAAALALIAGADQVVSTETAEFSANLQSPPPQSATLPKTTTGTTSPEIRK